MKRKEEELEWFKKDNFAGHLSRGDEGELGPVGVDC